MSRTSQGHNALPRPGLEPGSSDSEPSALTTGLLDKAWRWRARGIVDHANPSTLKRDWLLISPYGITPESKLKVMRIKEMITSLGSSWEGRGAGGEEERAHGSAHTRFRLLKPE